MPGTAASTFAEGLQIESGTGIKRLACLSAAFELSLALNLTSPQNTNGQRSDAGPK
jgi:hypothetical protein